MTDAPIQPVVEIADLRYRFPGPDQMTLNIDRFAVPSGEHTAIVGPSGCGKTTLLRLIAGILSPEQGSVVTLGSDFARMGAAERGRQRLRSIGMVFQDFALLDYLSAFENILLSGRLAGIKTAESRNAAIGLADRAGISHTLRRGPDRLSHGERQRVAVCRALSTRPKLVLCDEPTGNLDPARSGEIIELLLSEADSIGATVVCVTHDRATLGRFDKKIDFDAIGSLEGDAG